MLNAPVIESVQPSFGTTQIAGTLQSVPDTNFRIEVFTEPSCDPSGFGEGLRFIGFDEVTTDSSGFAEFLVDAPTSQVLSVVTATATNEATGDTSAFSACF